MCAGTGIQHSEMNPSTAEAVHLLQIWILPLEKNLPPSYGQKAFDIAAMQNQWCCVVAPESVSEKAVTSHQNICLYQAQLEPGKLLSVEVSDTRMAWLQVATGDILMADRHFEAGTGIGFTQPGHTTLTATKPATLLWFDLPHSEKIRLQG